MEKKVKQIMKDLKEARDELRVQAHLFKADAKDQWVEVEKKWDALGKSMNQVGRKISEADENISAAAELLGEEIKAGYKNIKKSLKD